MSYARLGQSCEVSVSVLLDNRKFLPPNDGVYSVYPTKMYRYPGIPTDPEPTLQNASSRPEDLKTGTDVTEVEYFPRKYTSCTSCGPR